MCSFLVLVLGGVVVIQNIGKIRILIEKVVSKVRG